ncbi:MULTISPECIES: DUF3592 domain-containing protein [Streptomyces]|uniref:DUF3592 domain-containing protein n=3 Tax=Streptomyces TaxID=1883 RepID=A0ABY9JA89_9ACTN|nr:MULTISPECIES: DUF3592 domain-containing protein [unclassified Streptomyces]WSQ78116.1 DUF3592 domain-containing protein [Streptomyces sp. NBC_01213]TXS17555.1 DUF3592 domain-containing protein [Streptomyces sp. wa22]WLQ64732.1 DUF3592 domain-containing protein [Streptomyces sp. Alt3]WSQ85488.1 DUF3592 domain-containing protein [Streptomyces sp. NBC_01212]WSR08421.1 DUF3592 domain-containing protein [Streptomyces sp. NBC_01208]
MLAIRIFLFVMVCASSLVLITNLYALRKAKRLESSGMRVEGECVDHYWPSGGYVGVVCAYSAGDRADLSVRSSRYSVAPVEIGDVVDVIYDPQNPERSMLSFEVGKRVGFDTGLSVVVGTLAVAAVAGILLTL